MYPIGNLFAGSILNSLMFFFGGTLELKNYPISVFLIRFKFFYPAPTIIAS